MTTSKTTHESFFFNNLLWRSSFFQGFFIVAVFLCICLAFLPARYETNDDFSNILRLNSQGEFDPAEVSPYFSQTLWSTLLFLYQSAPDIPWYGLTVYLAIFVGFWLMISLCVRQCDRISLLILLPGCFAFALHCTVFVSFTAGCLVLELAVFLSLLEWAITDACPAKKPRIYGVLLLGCMLLSYSLRWELFLWGIAFSLPVMLFVTKLHLRKIWPYLLILIVCIAIESIFFAMESTPETTEFMHYDTLRRSFHDTVKGNYYEDHTPLALEKAGWSVEDYVLFRRWILYDDKDFNVNTLEMFLAENDPQQTPSLFELIPERLRASYRKSKDYTLLFLCTIVACILLNVINVHRMSKKETIQAVLALGIILGMILFFAYYRFAARVYIPLYLYAVILCLVLVHWKGGFYKKRVDLTKGARVILVCVTVLTLCAYGAATACVLHVRKALSSSQNKKHYIVRCLNTIKAREAANNPIMVLMDPSDSLCRESIHPLKEKRDYVDLMFMPAGTDINSPRYRRVLETLELSSGHEFITWTINNNRVLFAFCSVGQKIQEDYTAMWLKYINRRNSAGGKVAFKMEYDFRNKSGVGLIVYKAVRLEL